MRIVRALVLVLGALLLLAFAAASYLLGREAVPESSDFRIDPSELETLAHALPGPLPLRVNHHLIAQASMPRAAVFSGFDFTPHEMVHGAYQIVYGDGRYILVDAGFGLPVFELMAARGGEASYDGAAFAQLKRALVAAQLVVMTHEHADHIQGLAEVDDLAALTGRVVMPRAQYESPQTLGLLPPELLRGIEPIAATGSRAIAPGVVIQPAPGHTPGSQLVYVQTEGGQKYLLIGDVAWHMDMIRKLEYRPRLITDFFLGEDRDAVMDQLRSLHELSAGSGLTIVSSHDLEQLQALQADGRLGTGLELSD